VSTIEIIFTGMADGIDPQLTSDPVNYSINAFVSPYTLTYQFDNGNLLSASLTLDALNFTVGPGINWNLWGLDTWRSTQVQSQQTLAVVIFICSYQLILTVPEHSDFSRRDYVPASMPLAGN
jgi:hypothetical protein